MPFLGHVYFLLTFTKVLILSLTGETIPIHRSHFCSNTTTFSHNSAYQSNLNSLLSSLYSTSKLGKDFYQITAGGGPSTTVYGSYLCRGDVDADACQIASPLLSMKRMNAALYKTTPFYSTTSACYDTPIDLSSTQRMGLKGFRRKRPKFRRFTQSTAFFRARRTCPANNAKGVLRMQLD
ncbi:Gnk2-like domain containing protein [Parasponia andersonii]|uniref:Gnk2-like domain containing protein n=1 Tax=Parasponia andersonii TaxID=3476 RepID=A0A2P5AAW0_PARAD|nr:Gnk2-like domain containing protein [Parasponia andersonii]